MNKRFKIKDIEADIYIADKNKFQIEKLSEEINKLYTVICDMDKVNNSLYSILDERYLENEREILVGRLKEKQNELMEIIKDNMVMNVPEYMMTISPQDFNEMIGIDRNSDIGNMLGNSRPIMFNGI